MAYGYADVRVGVGSMKKLLVLLLLAGSAWGQSLIPPGSAGQAIYNVDGIKMGGYKTPIAAFSTFANANNNALKNFYACNPFTTICRIIDNADSDHTCWTPSTCPFGPQHEQNLWAPATMSIMQRRGYPIYSSGIIGPMASVNGGLFNNGILPGITASAGVTQVALTGVGPQQATGTITGGGTISITSGNSVTIGVSTFVATPNGTPGAFNRFRVYCAITSTTRTVTISGQSAVTACTGTNASNLAQAFTVTNTAGTTALTVVIACTVGTCNLGGWEEIYTTSNNGYVIDGFEGAAYANTYWLGSAANCAYLLLAQGTVALLDVAIGINDSTAAIAPATVSANVAAFIANWPNASVLIWNSYPYTFTGSANYPAIQAALSNLALTNGYDVLNVSDVVSSNTSINYWVGLENSDFVHQTDMASGASINQWWGHVNGSQTQSATTYGPLTTSYVNGYVAYMNSTDVTSTTDSSICYVASMLWCGSRRMVAASGATFQSIVQDGVVGTAVTGIGSNGGVASVGSWGIGSNTTAGTQTPTLTNLSIVVDATNHIVQHPYNTVVLTAAYTNATTTFSNVQDATPHALGFAVNASQTMVVNCMLMYQVSAGTDGLIVQWTGPASPTGFEADMQYTTTGTTTVSVAPVTALSTQIPTTGTAATATTNFIAKVHATLINGANAGTLQLQAKGVGTGTLTIGIGSFCHAE